MTDTQPGYSTLSKAKELDDQAAMEQSEAERLREEVLATRRARATRQAGRSISSISAVSPNPSTPHDNASTTSGVGGTFRPSAVSYPVSRGVPNRDGGPTSLAHFMGGKQSVTGPVLNKPRPELMDGAGMETDPTDRPTETFLSKLMKHGEGLDSGMRKGNGIAMPGMVRPATAEPASSTRPRDLPTAKEAVDAAYAGRSASVGADTSTSALNAPPLTHPNALEKPTEIILPSRSPSIPTYISPPSMSGSSGILSTPASATDKPASSAGAGKPLLAPKPIKPVSTSSTSAGTGSPSILNRDFSPSSSNTVNSSATPSLTRLKGSNLVKERLKWGEEKATTSGSATSSPSASPAIGAAKSFSPVSSPSIGEGKLQTVFSTSDREAPAKKDEGASTPRAQKRASVLDRYNPSPSMDESKVASYKASYGVAPSPAASPRIGSESTRAHMPDAAKYTSQSAQSVEPPSTQESRYLPGASAVEDDLAELDLGGVRPKISEHAPSAEDAGFDDDDGRPRRARTAENPPAARADYKASYGVSARSLPIASTPAPPTAPSDPEEPVKSTSASDYKASYGAAGPRVGTPKQMSTSSVQSGLGRAGSDPPVEAKSGDSYKASYGMFGGGIARTASPAPEQARGADNAKPSSGEVSSGAPADYKSSYGVRPNPSSTSLPPSSPSKQQANREEPVKSSSADYKSSYSVGLARPASSASQSRVSPAPSPKPSLNLPISVSPAAYHKPKSPSPTGGTFQPSMTSYPVSLGLAPTHNRPTSLAHFMGGKQSVTGPVLNKQRPENMDGAGMDVNMGGERGLKTFLGNQNLLQEAARRKGKVALPGMVRPASQPKEEVKVQEEDEKRSSRPTTPSALPLPGHNSPKLPLPGEAASPPTELSFPSPATTSQEETTQTAADTDTPLSGAHSLPSPVLSPSSPASSSAPAPSRRAHIDATSAPAPAPVPRQPAADDPTMSTLIRAGYSTTHSLESVQPSDLYDPASTGYFERPTAMQLSDEFSKRNDDWQKTVKTWGRPGRHAPRPPKDSNDKLLPGSLAVEPEKILYLAAEDLPKRMDIPKIDSAVFKRPKKAANSYIRYISVDILSLSGSTATPLSSPCDTFYSSELLCIILRHKQGGLVETDLIAWRGSHSLAGVAEEKKLAELEARYRTKASEIRQGSEEVAFLRALGGRLVTRQGSRGSFDILNTTMYRVQSPANGVMLFDEVELRARSLCSAFSYVASVFQDLYVWYGMGSTEAERSAARQYALDLSQGERSVTDVHEGTEHEVFQEIMGQEAYASANYWRCRPSRPYESAAIYGVNDSGSTSETVFYLGNGGLLGLPADTLLVLDLVFESWVIIPTELRGHRQHIATAISAAETLSAYSRDRNRRPVHVLTRPSVVPRDIVAWFRNSAVSESESRQMAPRWMNICDVETAKEDLMRTTFSEEEVQYPDCLPVGLNPEIVGRMIRA